jgi:hypothetical protein
MLPEYKKTTNIGVGIGIILLIGGTVMYRSDSEVMAPIGALVRLAGLGVFAWGCGQYAKAKGYSSWFGALGLLTIVGLLALVLFPDRHKTPKP